MSHLIKHCPGWVQWGALGILAWVAPAAIAMETDYQYDALGRLVKVTRSDDIQTTYKYDAAGNRVQVVEGGLPDAPPSITVPASSSTGSYTVTWTAPPQSAAYELYESTSSSFSGATRVYSGTATSKTISGKPNGTYYYRVRACDEFCSGYRTGANGVVVKLPPSTPGSITVPASNTDGTYSITWGASTTGTVTAYELYEATNATFTGATRVYNGTGTTMSFTRGNGTYYYRVRACNGTSCSTYLEGDNPTVVTLPPGPPASINVPGSNTSGTYTVSWTAPSSGTVTRYELWEATNSSFTGATRVYNSSGTSTSQSSGNGSYYYRVRACNVTACGSYTTDSSPVVVTLPPSVPGSLNVPTSTNTTGSYSVGWSASTGTVTAYQLWEATNSSFSGQVLVYSGTALSFQVGGKTDGSYYYRVRACNTTAACSGYRQAAGPVVVSLPLGVPPKPTGLTRSNPADCAWIASWAATPTATSYNFADYADRRTSLTSTSINYGCPMGQIDAYRPKWVEACNSGGCGEKATFP